MNFFFPAGTLALVCLTAFFCQTSLLANFVAKKYYVPTPATNDAPLRGGTNNDANLPPLLPDADEHQPRAVASLTKPVASEKAVATNRLEARVVEIEDQSNALVKQMKEVQAKLTNLTKETKMMCRCVDCQEDEQCGGLWKANNFPAIDGSDPHSKEIHIVVSHCKRDLHWISNFTEGYKTRSIHVISKCGKSVEGAPETAIIERLPNVGRCDHSYAYYIANILRHNTVQGGKDSIVVFLKDDMTDLHQLGAWATFESMVRIASSTNGFSCGVDVSTGKVGTDSASAYHDVAALSRFAMGSYNRNKYKRKDSVEFKSKYANLGEFYESVIEDAPSPKLAQVCYGGIFAASLKSIEAVDMQTWKRIEASLSRGDNIEEGHFMERSWARILSKPLESYQIEAILSTPGVQFIQVDDDWHNSKYYPGLGLLKQDKLSSSKSKSSRLHDMFSFAVK